MLNYFLPESRYVENQLLSLFIGLHFFFEPRGFRALWLTALFARETRNQSSLKVGAGPIVQRALIIRGEINGDRPEESSALSTPIIRIELDGYRRYNSLRNGYDNGPISHY